MLNKNKFILKAAFLLLFYGTAFGQHPMAPGFFEAHVLPSYTANTAFYVYRIPYNRFVFIKGGDVYKAGFRINIEVTDSTSKHITRQVDEKSFSVYKYEETNSNDSYYEGLCSFNIGDGKYHLSPAISDLNSSKEFKLPDVWIDYDTAANKDFLPPFIIMQNQVKCGNNSFYKLANFNKSIPFDGGSYNFILPSADTLLNVIYVILINNRDTVLRKSINENYTAGLLPTECDGNILLQNTKTIRATKNFILKNFSKTLDEGSIRVVISKDSSFRNPFVFNTDVKWFNKPFSLTNPADAIKILKYIEKPSVVDSLLSFSREDYEKELKNYWKKYEPASQSKFNPIMEEYYSRIDYAVKNYSALSEKNGSQTDRGKIYIKYGMPNKIERSSDRYGKMVEKWIYTNSNLAFEFTDLLGAGNYTLKK
ncbi:MAG: GWxTD domain-containing protein [Ignavibacteriaceae bacterium]|nr:GWxTD domain-containing protein [Ignavibacteriaceae bacterium]